MNTTALTNLTLFWNDYLGRSGILHPQRRLSQGDVENLVSLQRAAELTAPKQDETKAPPPKPPQGLYSTEVAPSPAVKTRAKSTGGISQAVRKAVADFPGVFTTRQLVKALARQGHTWSGQQIAVSIHGLKKLGEVVVTKKGETRWDGHEYVSKKNRKKLVVAESPPEPEPDQRNMTPVEALRYRRKRKIGMIKEHESCLKARTASVLEYISPEHPSWVQATAAGMHGNLVAFDTFRIRVTNPKGVVTTSPKPPWWDDEICGE